MATCYFAPGPALGTSLLSSYFHNSHKVGGGFVSILQSETGAQRGEMSPSSPHFGVPLPWHRADSGAENLSCFCVEIDKHPTQFSKASAKYNYRIDCQERIGSVLITSLTITEMPRNIPKNICKLNGEADLFTFGWTLTWKILRLVDSNQIRRTYHRTYKNNSLPIF